MSATGISGISQSLAVVQSQASQNNAQSPSPQLQNQVSRLGQDLQAGNLTQARQDLASLASVLPYQEFAALQEALQSGNVAAAMSAYSAVQEALSQASLSSTSSGATLNTRA